MKPPKDEYVYSPVITGKVKIKDLDDPRYGTISKIMLHTANEVVSAEELCRRHNNNPTLQSYHYYIDSQGEIWQQVPENFKCNSSSSVKLEDVTVGILVANSFIDEALPVSRDAIEALINLIEDICRRNQFLPKFTNDTTGSLIGHYCTARTDCPGPFLRSKMLEISLRVTNRIKGLPDKPMLEKGFFRVRGEGGTTLKAQKGIFRDFNEAVARAYKSGLNVYDQNGMKVYDYKLSSLVTMWDQHEEKHVGDYVLSVPEQAQLIPGSCRCYKRINGSYMMYVPGLGGFVPMKYISQTENSKKKNSDGGIHYKDTVVYMDPGFIEEIDEKKEMAKVHGHWWPLKKLMIQRTSRGD